jgi:HNH endonuclease
MPLALLSPIPNSWAHYRVALDNCDQRQRRNNISIFQNLRVSDTMEMMSWIVTISEGRRIITHAPTWHEYEISVLLGQKYDHKDWGLLGHMRATAKAALNNRQTEIRNILHNLLDISSAQEFATKAVNAMEHIKGDYIGVSVATRLITLARPDRAVSINNESAGGFAKFYSGLPKTPGGLGTAKNYAKLLDHIYAEPWYKSPEPQAERDKNIWSMRAALLDAFVYLDASQQAHEAEQEIARLTRWAEQATRPGQQQFSTMLRQNYGGRCAITGCNTSAALEAAHIRVQQGIDDNSPENGLLLRSDIHALFDALLITLSEDCAAVEISDALTDPSYGFLRNAVVLQPEMGRSPSRENIRDHRKRFSEKEKERTARAAWDTPKAAPC